MRYFHFLATLVCLLSWPGLRAECVELPVGETFTIRKLLAKDCRILRAFAVNPIDGCTMSRRVGKIAEYPDRLGAGICYSYKNNDGLHVTLSEDEAFDTVILRGGACTKMYADATAIGAAGQGELLWTFQGGEAPQLARFKTPVKAKIVSFFETTEGRIADVKSRP